MPNPNKEREVKDRISKAFEDLEKLLEERAKLIQGLEQQNDDLRGQLRTNEEEHQDELSELDKKIDELTEMIKNLTGGESAIPIGILVKPVGPGRVRMLDNHKTQFEVNVLPKIKNDELEEGREVKYLVHPKTGNITIFEICELRRGEEKVIIEEILENERAALVILPGDARKIATIGWKVKNIEKGDEVYYNSTINFITGIVPKKKEKVDLNKIERKTYQDIGGLKKQIEMVREVVELPLKAPQFYEHFGVKPLKGILLTGPPGCGKTLIGKAVANESGAYFIYIRGPEFISSYVGESAARLRAYFDVARRNAPAIIFFDELESIAVERDETEHTHDRQVVAQLLSLMDGLIPTEKVIVIAATNKPDLLDEAFERPGRFDRKIEIPVPDRDGRLQILQIYTKNMPLASDVSLGALADVTHGFTGADIEVLCKEAALKVIEGLDLKSISEKESLKKIKVSLEQFNFVLAKMKPSVMRRITFQKPQESWADVGGLDDIKQKLEEAVKWPLLYPELLKAAKQKSEKGLLLVGPPGCGKTLIARALAHECGVNFIPVKGPEFLHELVGRSERNVREVFRKARQAAPCIIFFDEIDALASNRGAEIHDSGVGNRVTSQLLNEIDGIEENKGIFVLAATNRLDLVDFALWRTGRLKPIAVPLPGEEAREKIFMIHTKGKPLAEDVDLKALAKKTKLPAGTPVFRREYGQLIPDRLEADLPFSGADIENICREATQKALRDFLAAKDPQKDCRDFKIYMKHFEQAFEEIISSVKNSAKETEDLNKKEGKGGETGNIKVKRLTNEDLKKVY